jgi:ribonuclease HI
MDEIHEETDGAAEKNYSIAGMTVAMNSSSDMKYLVTDHLASVVAVAMQRTLRLPLLGRASPSRNARLS